MQNWCVPFRTGEIELPYGKMTLTVFHSNSENTQKIYKQFSDHAVDYDKIKGTILIRNKRDGDSLSLAKRHVTKKIKKIFNEDHIPPDKRAYLPLITDNNAVVWLAGYGTDRNYQVTQNTENILVVEFEENDK
ncbi:hypothetical protein SDC9_151907 [bioreactor metagenome]|uniref:Lysidine-tRNA(Ile) synthetase C-terminal domain-containing protein n=1 Tax=bioreactor metagenome TaxID=1076179 RepID=A0A645ETW2_9ZZZZ